MLSKRLASQHPGAQRRVTEISMAGPTSFDPAAVANAMMTLVATQGWGLHEVSRYAVAQPGHWQILASAALHGPAGRLQAHLRNEARVAASKTLLHERASQTRADLVTILVQTEEQSFAGRGARGRASPPAQKFSA
jgi:hypothetical protein